jgi:hypothetical protein
MLLQLLPRDPMGRAAARMLTQRVSDEFVTAFKRVLTDQRDTKSVQVRHLHAFSRYRDYMSCP